MGMVSAKELLASLDKARNMGLVEESFDLCGHSLVVRNLRPVEIEAVLLGCKGLEDLQYINTYQREHVARGIVELDGFDLREIDFIDDEEPDPKNKGAMKRTRVERYKWLDEKIVVTWSQEAIFTAYRKIGDCTQLADKQAKNGVTFLTSDETSEEKFRRILGELKEAEEEVPAQLLDKTLEEFGLVRRSTIEELNAAEEKLSRLRREEEAAEKAAEEVAVEPEPPISPVAVAMAKRKPLNQVEEAPPPERVVPKPVQAPPQVVPVRAPMPSRAAELAALEGDADVAGALSDQMVGQHKAYSLQKPGEVAELGGSQPILDREAAAREAASIIDRPPAAGINPRFRPPARG